MVEVLVLIVKVWFDDIVKKKIENAVLAIEERNNQTKKLELVNTKW